jgi:hypothetical protein
MAQIIYCKLVKSSEFTFEQLSPELHSSFVHTLLAHFQVFSNIQETRDYIFRISRLQFHWVPNSWKPIIRRWISVNNKNNYFVNIKLNCFEKRHLGRQLPMFGKVRPHECHAINSCQIRISSQLPPRSIISGEQISKVVCVDRT